jgi:hypothetical protein
LETEKATDDMFNVFQKWHQWFAYFGFDYSLLLIAGCFSRHTMMIDDYEVL